MRRIAKAMPIVSVPLVASLVGEEPVSRADLLERVTRRLDELRAEGAALLTDEDPETVLEAGLVQLVNRRILAEDGGRYSILPERVDLLSYYAASIRSRTDAGAETMTSHAPSGETEAT
jgi:glycerol-3-phosphate O-acyltransferase